MDTGLSNHEPLLLDYVADVPRSVELQVTNKSMQVGEANDVRVRVTDSEGQPFPLEEFKFMKIRLVDSSPELERNF